MSTLVEHRYKPRGACAKAFYSREPEILVSGPQGTGKSRACLEKLLFICLQTPNVRCLIVRKTAVSLASSALVTWRKDVAAEALLAGDVTYYGGSAVEPAQYRFTNGSTITVGGMDKSTRILSTEYDIIYVQEATELSEENWQTLLGRLRNGRLSFQQLIADCNPDADHHWLYKRCMATRTIMYYSVHQDNPKYYTEVNSGSYELTAEGVDYMQRLDSMTGVLRKRYRDGLWVSAEGIVYDTFDPALHIVDMEYLQKLGFTFDNNIVEAPRGWNAFLAVDFGYRNPFVCQWWAEDPDGRLYLYREIYKTGVLVEDHGRLVALYNKVEGGPVAIITDHDAEGRATFEKYLGQGTTAAKKSVKEGIEAVQARLTVQPDGKPRIFFYRGALLEKDLTLAAASKPISTIQEFSSYVWDTSGRVGVKEAPVKENDHGMDACRYMVAHRDLVAEVNIRWLG